MTARPLKILLLEDSPNDAELVIRLLKKEPGQYMFHVSPSKKNFRQDLEEYRPDIILADNALPDFNATEALRVARKRFPHIPFILVTGTVSEEFAADIMKNGADDYILKDRLTRLPTAILTAYRHRLAEKEKTRAIENLVQSEGKYRTLVEHAFDGILIYSQQGIILDCNHSACHSLGYNPEALKQKRVQDLFFYDDLQQRPLNFEALVAGKATMDYRKLKRHDGSSIEMEISTKMMPDGNLMAIGRDVSDRKKNEENQILFTSIVNSSDDAIISTTLNGTIRSWNEGAARLYGYRADEAIGMPAFFIVPEELREEAREIFNQIRAGGSVHHFETQRVRKDGSLVPISLTMSPVRNSKGVIVGVSKIARDILDRKKAEQKIIQSEEDLKAIFDNSSEGFILTDSEYIIKAINNKIHQTELFNRVEPIEAGKNLLKLVSDKRRQEVQTFFLAALHGSTIQADRHYTKQDGSISWLNLTYTPVKKGDRVGGLCITVRDITDKKIAEQQKEFDRNNLNALINNTHDLMWSVDRSFRLITSNQAFDHMILRMIGRQVEKGTHILDWQFDPEKEKKYRNYYERAFAGEAFTEEEYTYTTFAYWAENSFYPIYEGQKVVGTACFSRDITRQKEAEEQLQRSFHEKRALADRMTAILNTLPANIALLDRQGIIIDVNKSWRDFPDGNGFQGRRFVIGENYIDLVVRSSCGDANREIVANGIRDIIDNKSPEFVLEYQCSVAGHHRWFRLIATTLKDNEYEGAVVMHIDVSKLKMLEQERLESRMNEQKKITRAMLEAQEKERNELGQELHDNICQILAAIKMKLTVCLTHPTDVNGDVIRDAVFNLNDAINETRNLSHRMAMPRFNDSNLSEALYNLAVTYTHDTRSVIFPPPGVDEEKIPVGVKETLYRIAQEQLHNIEKHAKASTVWMELRCKQNDVSMIIRDNGIGFHPKPKGNGIGLTNIKNRAEAFNGSVKIIAAPGEGCLMLISIPLPRAC